MEAEGTLNKSRNFPLCIGPEDSLSRSQGLETGPCPKLEDLHEPSDHICLRPITLSKEFRKMCRESASTSDNWGSHQSLFPARSSG
jgi:hypothetical protein